ncbi:hypothetical protein METBIDRAFT_29449 [Metschnikowia bicuspidata var. bicuspidata NRRL YB-4993]|uniref:Charged multivesicular body protein 7 n=1 Tax=Metschnikowia bicuspidata var. bicuspidata NRRL YB-4993 TaxID=869754 RepID=A0A1A0HFU2_9ASCO|nr:hypothetical protein METBIDRAFT_29449 [Metschnikowia bicuspidata var. bicuspidata NRRL YB-4993]OBA22871.1 hypothetical protein METBIDRAFT_29449 [Metschnikowia bicuspidata var. bicuspidata NRRL YB-4993]
MNFVFTKVPSFTESRAQSLFSDFSELKFINPEGYDANILAWEHLLLQCLRVHTFQSSITLPAGKLSETLASPQYGQPKSLDLVVRTLVENRVLIPWSVYKSRPILLSLYADFLSPRRIWTKLLSKFDLSFHSPETAIRGSLELYLHIPTLISRSVEILKALEESVKSQGCYLAHILNYDMTRKLIKGFDKKLSDEDVEAVLLYLSRDLHGLSMQKVPGSKNTFAIKIGSIIDVTPEDLEILDLKINMLELDTRAALLEKIIYQDIPLRLSHLIRVKAREMVLKNLLIKKAHALQNLELVLAASNELAELLNKIDQAKANKTLYESLLSANSALSSINKKISITEIDRLTAELEAEVALTDEISDSLCSSLQQNENEIDEELDRMEKDYKDSINRREEDLGTHVNRIPTILGNHINTESEGLKDPDIDNFLSTKVKNLLLKPVLLQLNENAEDNVRSEKTPEVIAENYV